MKFKLDENFGRRTQQIFTDAGHDAQTVFQESLSGASDEEIYHVCLMEERCLVTLDLDFSDVTRFPPEPVGGIVVIRTPHNSNLGQLEGLIRQFLGALDHMPAQHTLWIVEFGRIRVHQRSVDDESLVNM